MKILAFLQKQSFCILFIILMIIVQLLFPYSMLLSNSYATSNSVDSVLSIHLIGNHDSDKYWYGQSLIPLKINAYMESGNDVGSIPVEKSWISGYNSEKLGKQTVTIAYGGKTTTFTVTVIDYLKDIKVVGLKQNYKVGETLNLSDISITEITASGINKPGNPVNADMIKGFNTSTEGTKKLTINYGKNELGLDMRLETFITVSNFDTSTPISPTSPDSSMLSETTSSTTKNTSLLDVLNHTDKLSEEKVNPDLVDSQESNTLDESIINNIVKNIFKSLEIDEKVTNSMQLFVSIIAKISTLFI